jgi:signal transduction histidine kinase
VNPRRLGSSKRSRSELAIKSRQIDTLTEAIATYLRTGSIQQAGQCLLRGALFVARASYGFVGLSVDGSKLQVMACDGVDEAAVAELDGLTSRVLEHGKPLLTNGHDAHRQLKNFLGVPIADDDGVLGMIGVANHPRGFTAVEQGRLVTMAHLAGVFCRAYKEKQRLESTSEQLRQAQKMEALGQLSGGIAHDFANVLSIVGGYAERIAERVPPDTQLKSDIDRIQRAVDRGTSLTQQLLVFSRRQVRRPRVLDLNIVTQDSERMLRRIIGEDIALETRLTTEITHVRADTAEIQQIIVNLVLNARDAMPRGGHVVLETAVMEFAGAHAARFDGRGGRYAMLRVTDSGSGMDADTRARAFEPFFTTKPAGRGTGLGLATVYAAVKRAGGAIELESVPGQGTSVTIWMPATDDPVQLDSSLAIRPRGQANGEVILLVEDEDEVRELTGAMLRTAGYEVLEAATGEQALQVWRVSPKPVALLVADIVMPGASGPQVYRELIRNDPAARVLYITGHHGDTLRRHGYEKSSGPVLSKPFSSAQLLAAVRERLDSPR